MERRLAVILAADVAGYSRLMEADEEATVRALRACREVIDTLVAAHRGRVFGSAGDSVVAEFSSAVEAVRCAAAIQRDLAARDSDLPEDRRMRFRIGVNLGDVIVEGDDLLGDGVNIAARLESLAEAGGICLSRPVVEQIKKQLDLGYEYLGEHAVKNIAEPVRAYRVLTDHKTAGRIIGETKRRKPLVKVAALTFAVLLGAAAAIVWLRPWAPTVEPASVERMAFPLPDKPSIAVLPFDNLSGDPRQDHLASGLTEDIIAALSQVSSLFVIARNSTFVYRGQAVKVQQVAEDLGVRYVLEGSVQRSGDTVRITAQLVDAVTGVHLWAERYDRNMTDLFALQDEITDHIVTALQIELTEGEQLRVHRKHTRSLEAWNLLGEGVEHFDRVNKADNTAARRWFQKAVEVDRGYALAYALLAWTHWQEAFHGWSENRELSLESAAFLAEKARALDDELPDVYALQGAIHLFRREYDQAVAAGEKAVALNPNHATNTALLAMILQNVGRPQEAARKFKTAMRLSPYYPAWFLELLGFTYLDAGRPDDALAAFETFLARAPNPVHAAHAHLGRAFAHHSRGEDEAARSEVAKALDADPGISVTQFSKLSLNQDTTKQEQGLAILRGLGLPD
jgi:TolB-like protein/class 3 adenylate cyclase/Tfp pilus assembly protein PilF